MLRRRALVAGAAVLAVRPGLAATDPGADDVRRAAQGALIEVPFDADADVDRRMQDFLDKSEFTRMKQEGRLFVATGKASVKVTTADPDWVKYRSAAYAEALLNAQAALASEQNSSVLTRAVLDFTKGADDAPAYVPGSSADQATDVVSKILAVANGRLDTELRNLGVDPKNYQAASPAQKTVMLKNAVRQTTTERSIGETIGACPVKTFEGNDSGGDYVVAAVIVTSPKMRDLTRQMLTARGEFVAEPERAQDLSRLYADERALLADFGVRRLFDVQGFPVVVSFAQWSSSYRGSDPALAMTYREAAKLQAETMADGQIADFVKGSLTYDRSSTTGREMTRVASTLPDSVSVETSKRAIDEMQRSIVRTSQAQITGLTTLRAWTGVHPASKAVIVGVIRMWSAAGEKSMRDMLTPASAQRRSDTPAPRGTPGGSESRQLMDKNDF